MGRRRQEANSIAGRASGVSSRSGRCADGRGMKLPRAPLLPFVLIVVAVLIAFLPALHGRLFFDDIVSLTQNPALESLHPSAAFDAPDQSTLAGRPFVAFTFALNHAVSPSPASLRFGNILLHATTALIAFDLIRRLLERTPGQLSTRSWSYGVAWCATLVWALHPIQTDAVSYVIQRTEILVTLMSLVCLHALVRGWTSGARTLPLACGAALLAAGSKEVAVVLPVLAALVHRGFFCDGWRAAWLRGRTTYAAIAVVTWVPIGLLVAQGPRSASVGFEHGVGTAEWLMTQAQVIPHYLRLVLWPDSLALIYEWPIVTSPGQALGGFAAMTLLLGATIWALRRAPRAGVVAAAVFVVLAPTSSFVPIWTEVVAERRMYLPSLAILALVIVGGARLVAALARPQHASVAAMVAVVMLSGVLGSATHARARLFGDGVGIWEQTTAHQPHSAMAHFQHGIALRSKQQLDAAIGAYDQALAIDPEMSAALNNKGTALMWTARLDEALAALDRSIALAPDAPGAHMNRGIVLSMLRRHAEALRSFETVLSIDADFPRAAAMRAAASDAARAQH